MTTITHDLRETLTGAEIEIYKLLCEGLTNQQISDSINMPKSTVGWHLRNVYAKLGVATGNARDSITPRRLAIFYGGTLVMQIVNRENDKNEKAFSLKQVRTAAKKVGYSMQQINDLVDFLEMDL